MKSNFSRNQKDLKVCYLKCIWSCIQHSVLFCRIINPISHRRSIQQIKYGIIARAKHGNAILYGHLRTRFRSSMWSTSLIGEVIIDSGMINNDPANSTPGISPSSNNLKVNKLWIVQKNGLVYVNIG